jgi:hypothetical protein
MEEPTMGAHLPDVLVEGAFSLVPGGSVVHKLISGRIRSEEAKLEDAQAKFEWEWLLDDIGEIRKNVARLVIACDEDERPRAADIAAILEAARHASTRTADPKKRRLLRRALVNAFDPALYREGLILRVLGCLEHLEYQDVAILRRVVEAGGDVQGPKLTDGGEAKDWRASIAASSVAALQMRGLVLTNSGPGAVEWFQGKVSVVLTELGRLFLRYVQEDGHGGTEPTD